jgi:hypothetical protein
MEHQIVTLTASAGHRNWQVLPSASPVSQEMLRGETASVRAYVTRRDRKLLTVYYEMASDRTK